MYIVSSTESPHTSLKENSNLLFRKHGAPCFSSFPYIPWKQNFNSIHAELNLRQIDDETWMVVNGNCQAPGWDFTLVKAPHPSKLLRHLGKTWPLSSCWWCSNGSPVPNSRGAAVCEGAFALLQHCQSQSPSHSVFHTWLIRIHMPAQHVRKYPTFYIWKEYLTFSTQAKPFLSNTFWCGKKKTKHVIQTDPQSIIWDSWGHGFFGIHNFPDFRNCSIMHMLWA